MACCALALTIPRSSLVGSFWLAKTPTWSQVGSHPLLSNTTRPGVILGNPGRDNVWPLMCAEEITKGRPILGSQFGTESTGNCVSHLSFVTQLTPHVYREHSVTCYGAIQMHLEYHFVFYRSLLSYGSCWCFVAFLSRAVSPGTWQGAGFLAGLALVFCLSVGFFTILNCSTLRRFTRFTCKKDTVQIREFLHSLSSILQDEPTGPWHIDQLAFAQKKRSSVKKIYFLNGSICFLKVCQRRFVFQNSVKKICFSKLPQVFLAPRPVGQGDLVLLFSKLPQESSVKDLPLKAPVFGGFRGF